MEYIAWNVAKKVTFVVRPKDCREEYATAYIVFDNKKSSLIAARKWAGEGYTEVTTENDGFEVELLNAAPSSSRGSKLSFWMCKITKDSENISYQVGLNSDLLCMLMRETDFLKGKCTEKLVFARHEQGLTLLSKNTERYKQVMGHVDNKAKMSKNKTSKWEKGVFYETVNTKSAWIGDIHLPLDIKCVRKDGYSGYSEYSYNVTIKPTDITHIVVDYTNQFYFYHADGNYTESRVGEEITFEDYVRYAFVDHQFKYSCKDKLPSRVRTDLALDTTDFEKYAKKYIDKEVNNLKSYIDSNDDSINLRESWLLFLFATVDGKISDDIWEYVDRYIPKFKRSWQNLHVTHYTVTEGKEVKEFENLQKTMEYVKQRLSELYK